jgi:hypothetical protein
VIRLKGLAVLSDVELGKAYDQAIEMNLEQEFINLLQAEMEKRKIEEKVDYLSLLKSAPVPYQ